ncbi:MAG: hypothetical protein LBJ91_07700 [Clostridiales Family XIII bacterium]|jgi:hypothetical protein|nr:hypothetical protein [Clostridiales Family XIII bacterium]
MRIIDSARKHGIADRDIEYVFELGITSIALRDEPTMIMVFGFDTIGRGLEIGYIVGDNREDVVIHAMKIRNDYKKYLHDR